MIFEHLVKEFKKDLNSIINEWQQVIAQLKQPASSLEILKTNKSLFEEITMKLPQYEAMREPIRKKYQFIQQREEDIQSNELTEEDKQKLEDLDQKFIEFKEGLAEAETQIRRCYNLLKKDVDDQIDDFKKECVDLKNNFKLNAPYGVTKDGKDKAADNSRAFDKLAEYKSQTVELRNREEELKFGLDIFEIE